MNSGITKREELINIAGKLFYTKGYSKTSVQNIIDEAQIAKGTFYHYFKSKEDLLYQFTEAQTSAIYDIVYGVVDEEISAVDKFIKIFKLTNSWKQINLKTIRFYIKIMTSNSNLMLKHNLLQQQLETMAPVYTEILEQGVKEGSFNIRDSKYTASFLLNAFANFGEITYKILDAPLYSKDVLDQFRELIINFEDSLERILGIESGTIHIIEGDQLEQLLASLLED